MKILVPLDGSQLAEMALPLAEGLARRWQGGLTLVRVVDEKLEKLWESLSPAPLRESEREVAALYVDHHRRKIQGLPCEAFSPLGSPAATLAEQARALGCDLICLASHGRSGMERWLLGSVAEKLLQLSSCPVLLVKSPESSAAEGYSNVLVAHDGERSATRVVHKLAPFLKSTGGVARVHVLRASGTALSRDADEETVQFYLNSLERELHQHQVEGAEMSYQAIDDEPAPAILKVARERGCDLIAMATRAQPGLAGWMLGSVTAKVARHCQAAVLAYPPENGERGD